MKHMEERGKKVNLKNLLRFLVVTILVAIFAITSYLVLRKADTEVQVFSQDSELLRAITYEQFLNGDENIEGTDNVKFSAFFLRDLDGDGYAEKIKGTCKEVGTEDTLYMEVIVQTAGYLKDAKIQVDGKNFYFQTALPKDNQIKNNVIGNNVKQIEFNDIPNGTQKMITGVVRSGNYANSTQKYEAVGNNINNYSRNDNTIVLTGTYVSENGTETRITKEVKIEMDWYGSTSAEILSYYNGKNYKYQNQAIENVINREKNEIDLIFEIVSAERNNELTLNKSYLEGTVPQLNGYDPISVSLVGDNGTFSYDENTKTFTIIRECIPSKDGMVSGQVFDSTYESDRVNQYKINIKYPIAAYNEIDRKIIDISIPLKAYYEGFNNPNSEFVNPYKSNIAQSTLYASYTKHEGNVIKFEINTGKYIGNPFYEYTILKEKPLKIYNGVSTEEKDDVYVVDWQVFIGENDLSEKIVMKEEKPDEFVKTDSSTISMENITSNVGVGFYNSELLQDNSELKIYDDETNVLLLTVTKNNIYQYTFDKPFRFEFPVKHLRVEITGANANRYLNVYALKELDDEYITNNYTEEEFDNLQYIKSTLNGYMGDNLVETTSHSAIYRAPQSYATISLKQNVLSTQETEYNELITIGAEKNLAINRAGWKNADFLIKIPDEIIETEINDVIISNNAVAISSYEYFENEKGKFIKIDTNNSTDEAVGYSIILDVNITPDPRIVTMNRSFELFASNEEISSYYSASSDIYDVNGNLNFDEIINKTSVAISFVAPNSLLTNQTISEYDEDGSIVVSPEIADAKIDRRSAKVGVHIKNNYTSTISEVLVLGKIPFEGNTYLLENEPLGSTYTTNIKNNGITIPDEIKDKVTIYYSELENPTKELTNSENKWKRTEEISDWTKIKSFLIDMTSISIESGKEYLYSYEIELPAGLSYNDVSYSHYAIFFCLDTSEGKYRTQTAPNKIGIRIAEKYDLELTKYQINTEKIVQGATYSLQDVETGDIKSAVTNAEGKLTIKNLYVERRYVLKEVKSPVEYALNEDEIEFIGHLSMDNMLTVEKIKGNVRETFEVTIGENLPKVCVSVEDEVRASLHITKFEKDTEIKLKGVKYKITGKGLPKKGKILTTNTNGEVTLNGLYIGEEYELVEVKAEGYKLNSDVLKFKFKNGDYSLEEFTGNVKNVYVTSDNQYPCINVELENEKKPTYNLEISKIKQINNVQAQDVESVDENTIIKEPLEGATFKLYNNNIEIGEFRTDSNGMIKINELEIKDTPYVLKEAISPKGYTKVKDIEFRIEKDEEKIKFIDLAENNSCDVVIDGNVVKMTIEDSPVFKLVKKDIETNTVLGGMKFVIYDENTKDFARNDQGEYIGKKEKIGDKDLYVVETNDNGEISAELCEGIYSAREVYAGDEYELNNEEYYFSIGNYSFSLYDVKSEKYIEIKAADSNIIDAVQTEDYGQLVGITYKSENLELDNGDTFSNKGSIDSALVRYDQDGNIQWSLEISGSGIEAISKITKTNDDGYIVLIRAQSNEINIGKSTTINFSTSNNGIILKLNDEGTIEWHKKISGVTSFYDCAVNDDHYYMCADIERTVYYEGVPIVNEINYNNSLIIEIDSVGQLMWTQHFSNYHTTKICMLDNNEFIIGGNMSSNPTINGVEYTTQNSDIIYMKYSNNEYQWAETIMGDSYEYFDNIIRTSDGGYLIAGRCTPNSQLPDGRVVEGTMNYSTGFLIKYNKEDEIEWTKVFKGNASSEIQGMIEISDKSGYILAMKYNEPAVLDNNQVVSGLYDCILVKIDNSGNIIWKKNISNSGNYNSIIEINNKEFLIFGQYKNTLCVDEPLRIYSVDYKGIVLKVKESEISEGLKETRAGVYFSKNNNCNIYDTTLTDDGGHVGVGNFSNSLYVDGREIKSKGNYDAIVTKFDGDGNMVWLKVFGGTGKDSINKVIKLNNGEIVAFGDFATNSVSINDDIYENSFVGNCIIRLNSDGTIKNMRYSDNKIEFLKATKDGGYFIGINTSGSNIKIEDRSITNSGYCYVLVKYNSNHEIEWISKESLDHTTNGITDVIELNNGDYIAVGRTIVRYDRDGNKKWQRNKINDDIFFTAEALSDGGYAAAGYIWSDITLENGTPIEVKNTRFSGFIMRFDAENNILWARVVNGNSETEIIDLCENNNGELMALVFSYYKLDADYKTFSNSSSCNYLVKFDNDGTINKAYKLEVGSNAYTNLYNNNGRILYTSYNYFQYLKEMQTVKNVSPLEVFNVRKSYNIVTDVELNGNVKGGTISGENEEPYENVRHGDTNAKQIVMTPDEGYEIVKITINGVEQGFTPNEDGTYTLPRLENITEDKNIVVKFTKSDNKITINKVDSESKERLFGTRFKINEIEERIIEESIIGNLVGNSQGFNGILDKSQNYNSFLGNLTNNGAYYFTNSSGVYVSNNNAKANTTANSFIPIDLRNVSGNYKIEVNASVFSESNYDWGYATISQSTSAPAYSDSNGRFIYVSGTTSGTYTSETIAGGQIYYLHLGYRKDSSVDRNGDNFKINAINLYKLGEENFYNFNDNDGKYESSNQSASNTTSNSYVTIDLRGKSGDFNLVVNAEISSQSGYDYGYATISETIDRVPYNSTTGRFVYLSGVQPATDYTTKLAGGKIYYLHLGYYKNGNTDYGEDKFTINDIRLELNQDSLIEKEVDTNISGQAITELPYGKYKITEIEAPEGYVLLSEPVIIEFRQGGTNEFTIENHKKPKLIVHHYIKGSEEKVAEDEEYTGASGTEYTTKPMLDLADYELEIDENGEYIIPTNAVGTYGEDNIEVIYYYVPKQSSLVVNHYIVGTNTPVLLADGEEAKTEKKNGNEGEEYKTQPIPEESLAEKYELVTEMIPNNADGLFQTEEVVVNYYYKIKRFNITTEVEEYEKTNLLGETELIRGGSISGEDLAPYEKVKYDENSVEDIIIVPDPGYEIKSIKVNDEPTDFSIEPDGKVTLSKFMGVRKNINVAVSFDKEVSQVIVHHYMEGTENKMPSIYGGEVQDEIKRGSVGDPYATKASDEISPRYEVSSIVGETSGTYSSDQIEIIYYYKEVPAKVITNHLVLGTTDPVPLSDGTNAKAITDNGYVTKPYTTVALTNIDSNYVLVKDSGNTEGEMTREDTVVNYYYAPKAKAKVNYIAVNSDDTETVMETIDYEGYDTEEYTSHSKDFSGYTLTDVPEYETAELTKDATTVFNYYYRKNTGLVEKHVDLYTGEIKNTEEHEGIVGTEYQIDRKVFEGYKIATNKKYYEKLVKDNPEILSTNSVETVDELLVGLGLNTNDPYIPKNYKGEMKEDTIEVVYYYVKEAKVIVEYHDINGDDPTKPIHQDDIIPGLEKDPYKTEPIEIDGYDLVTDPEYTPTNAEGEMTEEDIIVKYYYAYKTDVVVNYIDISNESKIDSDKKAGHEKDLYKMDQMDLTEYPNYRIVTNKEYYDYAVAKDPTLLDKNGVTTVGELLAKLELGALDPYIPANYKGEMTKDEIVVNYYYKKQAKVTVKHIDEATETVLKTEEATYDVGDTYTTGPETIEDYTLNENKLPGNATGEVKDGGAEIKYYYNKKTTPETPDPGVTPEPGGTTPEPKQDPTPGPSPEPGPGPTPGPAPAPAPQQVVKSTVQKIYNKVLPRTGDAIVQISTSIILIVLLLNVMVTVKTNQKPRRISRIEKHNKKQTHGKRFKL